LLIILFHPGIVPNQAGPHKTWLAERLRMNEIPGLLRVPFNVAVIISKHAAHAIFIHSADADFYGFRVWFPPWNSQQRRSIGQFKGLEIRLSISLAHA
jgi:hypothetical protein